MYCSHCGTQLGGAQFCPTCGQPALAASTSTLPRAPELSNYATPGSRKMTFDTQLQVPLAGWWRRVGATAIDGVILLIIGIVARTALSAISGLIVVTCISALYRVSLTCSASGQTFGNRAVSTRVRSQLTGERVSLGRGIIRWAVQHLPTTVVTAATASRLAQYFTWSRSHPHITSLQSIPLYIQHDLQFVLACWLPVFLFWLVNYLSPLWDRRNRTIHDIVAGTVVTMSR